MHGVRKYQLIFQTPLLPRRGLLILWFNVWKNNNMNAENWRDERREGEREGGREGGRKEGREREKEQQRVMIMILFSLFTHSFQLI